MIEYSREKHKKTAGVEKYKILEYMDNNVLKLERDGEVYYALQGEGVISNGMFFASKDRIFKLPSAIERQRIGKADEFVSLFRDGGRKLDIKSIQSMSNGFITTSDGKTYQIDECIISGDGQHVVVHEKPGIRNYSATFQNYKELYEKFQGEKQRVAKLREIHGGIGVFEFEDGGKIASILKTGDENVYIDGIGAVRAYDEIETDEMRKETVTKIIPPFFGPLQFAGGLKLGTYGTLGNFNTIVQNEENHAASGPQVAGYLLVARLRSFVTEEDKPYANEAIHANLFGVADVFKELDGHFVIESEQPFDAKERLIIEEDKCTYQEGVPTFEYILVPEVTEVYTDGTAY